MHVIILSDVVIKFKNEHEAIIPCQIKHLIFSVLKDRNSICCHSLIYRSCHWLCCKRICNTSLTFFILHWEDGGVVLCVLWSSFFIATEWGHGHTLRRAQAVPSAGVPQICQRQHYVQCSLNESSHNSFAVLFSTFDYCPPWLENRGCKVRRAASLFLAAGFWQS